MNSMDEFIDYVNQYKVYFNTEIPARANVNYGNNVMRINPYYHEDGISLCHELYHHYYERVLGIEPTEEQVEDAARWFYSEHRSGVDSVVRQLYSDNAWIEEV